MADWYHGTTRSICWDCERACCGCSWSKDFKPVKGWTAIPTKMKLKGNQTTGTYIVTECPDFKRDAYDYGMTWVDSKKGKLMRR